MFFFFFFFCFFFCVIAPFCSREEEVMSPVSISSSLFASLGWSPFCEELRDASLPSGSSGTTAAPAEFGGSSRRGFPVLFGFLCVVFFKGFEELNRASFGSNLQGNEQDAVVLVFFLIWCFQGKLMRA